MFREKNFGWRILCSALSPLGSHSEAVASFAFGALNCVFVAFWTQGDNVFWFQFCKALFQLIAETRSPQCALNNPQSPLSVHRLCQRCIAATDFFLQWWASARCALRKFPEPPKSLELRNFFFSEIEIFGNLCVFFLPLPPPYGQTVFNGCCPSGVSQPQPVASSWVTVPSPVSVSAHPTVHGTGWRSGHSTYPVKFHRLGSSWSSQTLQTPCMRNPPPQAIDENNYASPRK